MTTRTVATRLMLDISGYMGPLKAAGAGTRQFGSEFDKSAKAGSRGMDRLSQGALVAGAGILAGFGVAVKSAMDFDKQMSSVGAAAGKTGKDLNALRQAALQAGAATSFSATQAAKAEEELAKAGVSARDILGGGLKGALDLAAAGQIEVGNAAEIAATAMTQFGLSGDKVPHIADLLSAGANKASGSVTDMGLALKQGGLVAAQFGWSIEDTVGMLTEFAAAGLKGSDGGTSLKTMLLSLANPSKEAAALMEKLGLNTYDASGRFVTAQNLAGQLRDKLGGLTEAQRNSALATMFGSDAIRGASIAFQNGAAGTKKWADGVNDAGNAARTAAAKTDNLAGDLERLQGSLETALIKQGSGATSVLRGLAQAGEHAVNAFTGMPGPVQGVVTVLGLTVGSALAAAGAYGVMAPKVREASAALAAMGPAGAAANTALIGTTKWAGRAMVGLAALEVVNVVAGHFAEAAPDVGQLSKELERFAATGKAAGEMSRVFAPDLSGLKDSITWVRNLGGMKGAQDAMGWEPGFIASQSFSVTKHVEALRGLDQALARLVQSGNGRAAAAAVRAAGLSARETADMLPAYSGALRDAKDATGKAANSMATAGGQARVMASGLAAAVHEAGSLDKVLHGFNDAAISAAEAGIAWRQSLSGLSAEIRHNNGSTDANTQSVINRIKAAQEALSAIHAQTTATRGQSVANAQATTSHAQMRAAMINQAVAAGLNRAAVTKLIDALFKIPSNRTTQVSTPGAVKSRNEVAEVKAKLDSLKNTQTVVSQKGAQETAHQIWLLEQRLQRLTDKKVDIGVQMHGFSADSAARWLAGARAGGGPVDARKPYLVGERGPEVIVPARDGWVVPNNSLRDRVVIDLNPSGYGQTQTAIGRYASGIYNTVTRANAAAAAADVSNPRLGGGAGSSISAILAVARRIYPGAIMTSGYRPGANDYHGRGLAVDLIGGGEAGMNRIAAGFYAMSNRLLELIHSPRYFVKNGNRVGAELYRSVYNQHFDHVHVAANRDALSRRNGGVEAHTVGSPTVLYGERETGGEAFVPRIGNPQRSKAILDVAASWYGYGLHKMALGGVLGNTVTWGQVTPYVWNKLMQAGWHGNPGDKQQQLHGSWAQLFKVGWRGIPGDNREMLYPPGTGKTQWQAGVASAASELMGHLSRGGTTYGDLTYARASKNLRKYNDFLLDSFQSRHGDLRNKAQLMRFLNSYAHPGQKPPAVAAGASDKPAALTARDVAAAPSAPTFGNAGSSFSFTFSGPVGSRIELENWVTGYINDLRRQGRV